MVGWCYYPLAGIRLLIILPGSEQLLTTKNYLAYNAKVEKPWCQVTDAEGAY